MEYGELRAELQRLRDWKHSFLAEWYAARLLASENRVELDRLGKVVTEDHARVERLIQLFERQTAISEALAKRGPALPLGWIAKAIGLTVSLSAVGSFVVLLTQQH